jgi:ankyrin repeat protein
MIRAMKPLLPALCFAALLLAGCGDPGARTELKERGVESSDAALFSRAQAGDADVVKLLVRSGRSPNAVEKWSGRTPLMFAAEKGHLAVVDALIAARADVNAHIVPKTFRGGLPLPGWGSRSTRPTPGWTALMLAVQNGHVEVVRALLKAGAKANVQGELDRSNSANDATPLILAVEKGHLEIARLLVEAGANADVSDLGGRTPLMLASSVEMLQLLQKAGVNLNQTNADGRTPLWTAVSRINEPMIRFLVQSGADPDARDRSGQPLIMSALGRTVPVLVELGADVNARDAEGQTAVMRWARETRYQNAVLNFYKLGANLDGLTPDQATGFLRDAVAENDIDAARAAIKIGANANAGARFGGSLLVSAAYDGKTGIVRLLLDSGADVKPGAEGWSALHGAALMGRREIAEMLITAGANVNAMDKHGRTPLNQAVQFKHEAIAQLLREAGATE